MSKRPPCRFLLTAVTLGAVLAASPALASEGQGLFLSDDWRQPHKNVLQLFAADLVAIPANIPQWSRDDWAVFTSTSAVVLAFMLGNNPLDVQVQDWSHRTFGLRETRFTIWQPAFDAALFTLVGGTIIGSWLYGLLGDKPVWAEFGWLVAEAFAVAEIYHLIPKLLLGREGPMNGDGKALIFGPTQGIRLFPAGTPSGHAASLYAVMGVTSAWFENPWLTAALQLFGSLVCATMVVDDYHFLSDTIWGAAMGWNIGTFVVRHRASRGAAPRPKVQATVVPMVDPRTGGLAVSVGLAF